MVGSFGISINLGVLKRGLLWKMKDSSLIPIPGKITRVFRCSVPGIGAEVLFLIISQHHSLPCGLWIQIHYSKMIIKVQRCWHSTRIHLVINSYSAHHHVLWKCLSGTGHTGLQVLIQSCQIPRAGVVSAIYVLHLLLPLNNVSWEYSIAGLISCGTTDQIILCFGGLSYVL